MVEGCFALGDCSGWHVPTTMDTCNAPVETSLSKYLSNGPRILSNLRREVS